MRVAIQFMLPFALAMRRFKDPLAGSIRVLKTNTCNSLSGKSRLTYGVPDGDVGNTTRTTRPRGSGPSAIAAPLWPGSAQTRKL